MRFIKSKIIAITCLILGPSSYFYFYLKWLFFFFTVLYSFLDIHICGEMMTTYLHIAPFPCASRTPALQVVTGHQASSPRCAPGPHAAAALYLVLGICQCCSLSPAHLLPLPLGPQVCSLRLRLFLPCLFLLNIFRPWQHFTASKIHLLVMGNHAASFLWVVCGLAICSL